MEANNNSSSSTWSVTISETIKGKGTAFALLLLAVGITTIIHRCFRGRQTNLEADLEAEVELPVRLERERPVRP